MRPVWMVSLGVVGVAVASCSSPPSPPSESGPGVIADPPAGQSSPGEPREATREAYDRFWRDSWQVQDQPSEQWPATLRQVADGPLVEQIVERTHHDHRADARLWGHVVPHVRDVQVDGEHAVVTDCQDTSQAGRLEASGATTVGVGRNPVTAQVDRTPAGWRVTAVAYPGGAC